MPRVIFEPRISVFERAKTFRALDLAATVLGLTPIVRRKIWPVFSPHPHPNGHDSEPLSTILKTSFPTICLNVILTYPFQSYRWPFSTSFSHQNCVGHLTFVASPYDCRPINDSVSWFRSFLNCPLLPTSSVLVINIPQNIYLKHSLCYPFKNEIVVHIDAK